jgi:hypothetical protein
MVSYILQLFTNLAGYFSLLLLAVCVSVTLVVLVEIFDDNFSFCFRLVKYFWIFVMISHILLYLDGLPWMETFVGLLSHAIYATSLSIFRYDFPQFLRLFLSIVGFSLSNILWLQYFYSNDQFLNFLQIIGFFVILVWPIPIAVLISILLGRSNLPTTK